MEFGALLTTNLSLDVGTGKPFQGPALRDIASRAPICTTAAPRRCARFDADCGGGDRRGETSHLTATEIDDLVAYLEAL